MRFCFASLAQLFVILVSGCNTVDADECWPNTSGGFGGGGTIPIGAGVGASSSGDFFTPPPRGPLDDSEAPNPCIVAPGPCEAKCLADYETASIACGKIADDAQRRACQDGAYAAYKSCREKCQTASKSCTDMFDACQDKGMPCTRQIEWGKTLCAICRANCQANNPYSFSECYQCGFE